MCVTVAAAARYMRVIASTARRPRQFDSSMLPVHIQSLGSKAPRTVGSARHRLNHQKGTASSNKGAHEDTV